LHIVTCRLKAGILEPALFPRPQRVTHLGNNWGRLLLYNSFGWKLSVATEPLYKVFTIESAKRLLKGEYSREKAICFVKPRLTEKMYIFQKEKVSISCYVCNTYPSQRPSIFVRSKPLLSSERILHKDYDRKGSFAKNRKDSGRESQETRRQDKLVG
jgi:hypothetical protein